MTEYGDSLFRIKDLLGEAGRGIGLPSPVETGLVWTRWPEMVGPAVAAHAEPSSLRAGVLRVRADSPTWATEIGYLRDEIRAAVNRGVGVELVDEVRVWTGPASEQVHRDTVRRKGADPTPLEGTAEFPSDPRTALERARVAWLRRRK